MFKNHKKKYLYISLISFLIIFFIFLILFLNNTKNLNNTNLVQTYLTWELDMVINTYKNKKKIVLKEIDSNFLTYKENKWLDHYIYFFLYLCDNQNKIWDYYKEKASSDKEFFDFLNWDKKCREYSLDWMYEKNLKTDKNTQEFLYNNCWVNKEDVEKYKFYERQFHPTNILMSSYYLWIENKNNIIDYLEKFKNISEEDQEKYYDFLEKEYSMFYYDLLKWETIDYNKCKNYLLDNKIFINSYFNKMNGNIK